MLLCKLQFMCLLKKQISDNRSFPSMLGNQSVPNLCPQLRGNKTKHQHPEQLIYTEKCMKSISKTWSKKKKEKKISMGLI